MKKIILILALALCSCVNLQNQQATKGDHYAQLEKASLEGDVPLMYLLAEVYALGAGIERNDHLAIFWYTRAILGQDNAARTTLKKRYNLKFVMVADDTALYEGPGGKPHEMNVSVNDIPNKKLIPYQMR